MLDVLFASVVKIRILPSLLGCILAWLFTHRDKYKIWRLTTHTSAAWEAEKKSMFAALKWGALGTLVGFLVTASVFSGNAASYAESSPPSWFFTIIYGAPIVFSAAAARICMRNESNSLAAESSEDV